MKQQKSIIAGYFFILITTILLLVMISCKKKDTDQLLKDMTNANPKIRASAAAGLSNVKEPRSIAALIKVLKDNDATVRIAAFDSLVEIGGPSVEPLINVLKTDTTTRRVAAIILAKIGDPSIKPLIATLGDPKIQLLSSTILVKIGEPAVQPLISALQNKNAYIKAWAAQTLGEIKNTKAIEPLTVALKDGNKNVQIVAAEALKKIKGVENKEKKQSDQWLEILKDAQ